jgi:hypothetical protein
MNFQIAGDLALAADGRSVLIAKGVDRIRQRLIVIFGIARGSYEYSQVGFPYDETIGLPMNEGRLRELVRAVCLEDPEVTGVSDMVIRYNGNRAYSLTMKVHTATSEYTVIL